MDARATAAQLLDQAWDALGGPREALAAVDLGPVEPALLPSRLPVMSAACAAVAASTLAASVLDGARSGRGRERVEIDGRHVAVAVRSERFARTVGAEPAVGFAPLSRFWRADDGWVRLHSNYPWHLERALAVLGCAAEPSDVAAAIAGRSAEELESSMAAAGALAFAVRSPAAWDAHPQGRAVAADPLVVRGPRIESTVARTVVPGRFAEGVRVLDLTRVIAGPVATRTLAGWGADVLRLDPPALPESADAGVDTLPGKRSADLDLEDPAGRRTLERLLSEADVLVQGYRPGSLTRFGLDADDLARRHPHLVVVTLSAWGPTGPWARRRGFDSLVQCPTGIAAIEGDDDEPGALPAQLLDHATGYLAAAAAMLGVADRVRGRPRTPAALSLARTARWLRGPGTGPRPDPVAEPSSAGLVIRVPHRRGAVEVVAPPGRVGGRAPGWTATTTLGADAAAFLPSGPGT